MGQITAAEMDGYAAAFREQGFCLVPNLFSPDEIAALRARTDDVVAAAAALDQNDDIYDLETSHTRAEPRVRRIKRPHEVDPLYREQAGHPRIRELLRRIIGADVRLHHSKINLKSAKFGAALEWHQDWAFIPHTNMDLAIAAVMLDDCAEQNGPVLMIPGSHKGSLYDHHHDGVFYGAIDVEKSRLPTEQAVPMLGKAGSVSFHHPMTVHGSALNRSTDPRRLLFYEYAAADAWPLFYGVDYDEYESRMVMGKGCYEPRLEPVFVRMPYPTGAKGKGLIYAQQEAFPNKFFETFEA